MFNDIFHKIKHKIDTNLDYVCISLIINFFTYNGDNTSESPIVSLLYFVLPEVISTSLVS